MKIAVSLILLVWMVPALTSGQTVPTLTLDHPSPELPGEFTDIVGLRELSDGNVVIADLRERRLALIDLASNQVRAIGRRGGGPGEFDVIGGLYASGRDSTVAWDSSLSRILILDGARIVHTGPARAFVTEEGYPAFPVGAASGGGLLLMGMSIRRVQTGDGTLIRDSPVALRTELGSGRMDTIALLRGRTTRSTTSPSGEFHRLVRNPLTTEDQAYLFPDGWVAVAYVEPFRVDWISPSGSSIQGQPLPFDTVPVGPSEKEDAVEREARAIGTRRDPARIPDWPNTLPAFLPGALIGSPEGLLVIRRVTPPGLPAVHDVVDRRGELVGVVRTSANEALVAIGQRLAYTVVRDEWGIQRIKGHPWPSWFFGTIR